MNAEDLMIRAWLVLLVEAVLGGLAFVAVVVWISWAMLKAVGLL